MHEYPTIFHLISAVCAKEKISCVLIGGFAINYYKVSRSTADVDFLITKEDYERIAGLLEKEGLRLDYTQEVFARFTPLKPYLMDIDFMFVDKQTLDKIISGGKEISIAGQKFIVPSPLHLIALKLHSVKYSPKREYKDILDIIELVKANKIDVRGNEFKDLCLKYGREGIYNKILEGIE